MTIHNVTIEPVAGEYQLTCSQGDLHEKRRSRDATLSLGHLHIVSTGLAQLELASAGKETHD